MQLMNNLIELDLHLKDGSVSHRVISVKNLCFGGSASVASNAQGKNSPKNALKVTLSTPTPTSAPEAVIFLPMKT